MYETMEKVRDICEMLRTLTGWSKTELGKGVECVNTEEMGDAVDMLKDLADAEKNLWKACYYKLIVKAMMEEEENGERAGYDHYRYASGRFAPTGHGHYSGYTPADMREGHKMMEMADRLGYSHMEPRMQHHDDSISQSGSRYGYSYDKYMASRRNFHESGDPHHKEEMDKNAKEHMAGAMMTMRDIWGDADPEMKKKMKADLLGLVNEMN